MGRSKRPDQRSDERPQRRAALTVVDGGRDGVEVPEMPAHPDPGGEWQPSTVELWAGVWRSQVATAVDLDADRGKLLRWLFAWDQWLRTARVLAQEGPLDVGAQGGMIESPLARYLERQEKVIAAVEAEVGLGPYSRNRLGLVMGQAGLTAEELNRRIRAATDRLDGSPATVELDGVEWSEA